MLVAFGLIMKVITTTYGLEVNGLTNTVNYVLQILNLLQAGAAGASIYQMYKPVAQGDYEKVSIIMDSTRKFFCRVGTIFLILVFAISPVFGFAVKGDVPFFEKSLALIILGVNGAGYLFFVSYFDVLFSSHQKRFILSLASIISKLVYYGLVLLIVYLRLPYMLIYVATIIGTSLDITLLYLVYRKQYKPLVKKVQKGSDNFKIPHRVHLFVNQVAIQVITSLPMVLAALVGDLNSASILSYYFLVYNTMKMILNTMQLSVGEVFGNYAASKDGNETKKVYDILDFLFCIVGAFACICMAFLFMGFIYVYSDCNNFVNKAGEHVNVMYNVIPWLFTAMLAFYTVKQPYYMLNNVFGHYKETYLQAAVFAVVGVLLSVGLGLIDWTLILTGPILFYVCTYLYRMAVAKRLLPWLSVKKSLMRLAFILITATASSVGAYFLYHGVYPTNWGEWIIHALITMVGAAAILGIYIAAFERKEFVGTMKYLKAIFTRKNKKSVQNGTDSN